jgi:hypothetical protein
MRKTQGNDMLSEKAKHERVRELHQKGREALREAVVHLWHPETGAVWGEQEAAKRRLREARNRAEQRIDPMVLQLAYQRLPAVLAGLRDLREVATWYESATDVERRALQDLGGHLLRQRFGGHGDLGSTLGRLERDREKAMRTPELCEAEAEAKEVERAAAEAWKVANAEGAEWGLETDAYVTLRGVHATTHVEDVETNPTIRWDFSKRQDIGVIWRDQDREEGSEHER